MIIIHSDAVFRVDPGTTPNYDSNNPLLRLLAELEAAPLAAERERYLAEHLNYLFPLDFLGLYGPASPDQDVLEPELQDNKNDFQKQNVRDFRLADTQLIRGLVRVGDWTGPFLRLSYRGGPDSKLSAATDMGLGERIKLWLRVRDVVGTAQSLIVVPYNPASDRYEVEIWGYPGDDLRSQLDARGQAAIDRGELIVRTDLVHGDHSVFDRDGLDERDMIEVDPTNSMHPVLPLDVEVGWANEAEQIWDAQDGANYQYSFNMILRGWEHFLGVGISPNPHGGIGALEYRNLLSNYGRYAGRNELGRPIEDYNFDAFGAKDHDNRFEPFFAVDYMDLHILNPNCGIGLHRHRDNSEVFLMMNGRGYMVIGDWAKPPDRERCFEIRTLRSGHFAMLKGGNLHGLMNATDENISLFMFGGYD